MYIFKRTMRLFIGMCLLMSAWSIQALGVSEIALKSFLNQKLDAEIQLNSVTGNELDSLTVNIKRGNDTTYGGQPLRHEIVKSGSGHILRITSIDAIKEPIVYFQLEINWPGGQLLRDYILLIDPPGK